MDLAEKKQKVFEYVTEKLKESKEKYPDMKINKNAEELTDMFWKEMSDLPYDEIVDEIYDAWKKKIEKYKLEQEKQSEEPQETANNQESEASEKVVINDLLYYQTTEKTLHFHILPPSLKPEMEQFGGLRKYLEYLSQPGGMIDDGFYKIAKEIKEKKLDIDLIFAVSPTLNRVVMEKVFVPRGFKCRFDENGDFQQMFPESRSRGIVSMPKDKFLELYDIKNMKLNETGQEKQ